MQVLANMDAGAIPSGTTAPALSPLSMFEQALTPLHVAARDGDDAAITALLDKGADSGALCQGGCQCYDPRMGAIPFVTPLHLAVCSGHLSSAELLIRRGSPKATVHTERHCFAPLSALHTAAWKGNLTMCKMLISRGGFRADADVRDVHVLGVPSPLAFSIAGGNALTTGEYLIEMGAKAAVKWYRTHSETLRLFPERLPMALQCVPIGFRMESAFDIFADGTDAETTAVTHKFIRAIDAAVAPWPHEVSPQDLAATVFPDMMMEDFIRQGWAKPNLQAFATFITDGSLATLVRPTAAGAQSYDELVARAVDEVHDYLLWSMARLEAYLLESNVVWAEPPPAPKSLATKMSASELRSGFLAAVGAGRMAVCRNLAGQGVFNLLTPLDSIVLLRVTMAQDGEGDKKEVVDMLELLLQGFKASAKGDWEAVLRAWEGRGNALLAEAKAWGKVNTVAVLTKWGFEGGAV
ncbi:hypothetical protein B0H67DRAFT_125580 [Lasiosphaeris hirsuta]|uniref:Uncharacterized protein n=1 Tax=Lasiosphaeris hirsuta TaxID=260670 RepID=A0AA40B0J0_9PEZI|nr:hypothetical protein B0H67DRAFT_125580 [Lasiosphaeris hirsuta]